MIGATFTIDALNKITIGLTNQLGEDNKEISSIKNLKRFVTLGILLFHIVLILWIVLIISMNRISLPIMFIAPSLAFSFLTIPSFIFISKIKKIIDVKIQ